jgi:hypothetical protein
MLSTPVGAWCCPLSASASWSPARFVRPVSFHTGGLCPFRGPDICREPGVIMGRWRAKTDWSWAAGMQGPG